MIACPATRALAALLAALPAAWLIGATPAAAQAPSPADMLAQSQPSEDLYRDAYAAYLVNDYATARALALTAAADGHTRASVLAGRLIEQGLGGERDDAQAVRLLRAGARDGDAEAFGSGAPQQLGGIIQQLDAAALGEALTQQKIPVAMHDEHGCAGGGAGPQGIADGLAERTVVIVTDPGLEQIAEYIERTGAARPVTEEADKQFRGGRALWVEMQVGDKQGARHARLLSGLCYWTVTLLMTTGSTGTSPMPDTVPVRTFSMAFTESMPSTTLPKTA